MKDHFAVCFTSSFYILINYCTFKEPRPFFIKKNIVYSKNKIKIVVLCNLLLFIKYIHYLSSNVIICYNFSLNNCILKVTCGFLKTIFNVYLCNVKD